jgi:ankyrin repeat protein
MMMFLILGLVAEGSEEFLKAMKEGDFLKVQSLVAASPSLAAVRSEKGVSAPLLALYYRKREVADFLVSRKEEIEPLDVFEAAAFGRTERLKAILDEDASRANAYAADGFFPLGLAAFFGQEDAVKLLLARGADPNFAARNPMKVRAIHAAAASGSLAIVEALVGSGADVDATQEKGFTPLHEAALTGKLELARLLLDHGARLDSRTEDGRTALDIAREAKQEPLVALLTRER